MLSVSIQLATFSNIWVLYVCVYMCKNRTGYAIATAKACLLPTVLKNLIGESHEELKCTVREVTCKKGKKKRPADPWPHFCNPSPRFIKYPHRFLNCSLGLSNRANRLMNRTHKFPIRALRFVNHTIGFSIRTHKFIHKFIQG